MAAQAEHFTDDLLPAIRRAASVVPGDAPSSVRLVLLSPFSIPRADWVEGAGADTIRVAVSVFQLRFPRGWIVVDAGIDRAFAPGSKTFADSTYAQIHEAMRDARLVLVTHEHFDHVAGVLRSPYLAAIQRHTMLLKAQVQTLMRRPDRPEIRLDSAGVAQYLQFDYEPIVPIAPGVVLIKSPGHSPGSQMIYVRLHSGEEVVLAGDVAWNMDGITNQRHKPEATIRLYGISEDRGPITSELRWLRDVQRAGVHVVLAHDVAHIETLVSRGILAMGFDVRNP
jgi:glyoxylase-like metal-dependent hydrolase (beta-lactamase superfamily II)